MIEITTFHPADGAAVDELVRADDAVRTRFLYQQPGLLRATTARGGDGEWAIVVLWRSDADADAAEALADADPASLALLAMADPTTVRRRRYATLD